MVTCVFLLSLLVFALLGLFYCISKTLKMDQLTTFSFECGFTAHFYSRHSFSIHYFIIAAVFLFLDLEICFICPLFMEDVTNPLTWLYITGYISVLLGGLLKEWVDSKLEWEM